ncbi:MAG: DUF2099 family protein, partial [Candidatus Syntropharchaeia archaeon]
IEKKTGKKAAIFGVHTTGMGAEEAEKFMRVVDICTACASKYVREHGKNALLQLGTAIPVFAMTEIGKELLLNRIKFIKRQMLIKTSDLPNLEDKREPRPIY